MDKPKSSKLFLFCCLGLVLLAMILGLGYLIYTWSKNRGTTTPPTSETEPVELKRFTSEEEFKEYLESSAEYGAGLGAPSAAVERGEFGVEEETPLSLGDGEEPSRVSETTVQVRGVDEPDIAKTDGENLYFSQSSYWDYRVMEELVIEDEEAYSPTSVQNETKVVKAFPPEDLETLSGISKTGNLLLYEDTLVVFQYGGIYGYDVSDPNSPELGWDLTYESSSYLVAARLYNDKIYLVTRTSINRNRPCPLEPLTRDGKGVTLQCTDVYHPVIDVPVDTTFVVLVVDIEDGDVEKKTSFVGSSDTSVVYMSTNSLYITYSYYADVIEFFYDFFNEKCLDLVPASVVERLGRLQEYDISASAKYVEFEIILNEYIYSLSDDEQLEVQNELTNRMDDYYSENKRDLERTGVVKVGVDDLEVEASGSVPGKPLNQFSLDEYEDHLRIATTIGWSVFAGTSSDSISDVYVLDGDLNETGSVRDLGEGERIYSVRFVQDKGYVVTFREIDPFYVLDLADASSPELKGELKIPGYSSYLHPITKDKILGIGKEDQYVKLSLFDVSSPSDPKEISKYTLQEYWSDVLETHHAFLLDSENEIFFIPGSQGGYIFSYKDDELEMEKAVSNIQARRAIYIDEFLYVIGEVRIVVLDERDWEVFKRFEFE